MKPFTSDTDLDGLVANYEKTYDYSKLPPNVRHVERVDLRSDPGARTKRCLCVIEFLGNGLTSRAVVQKGNLTLVQKSTIAGQFAYIVDEEAKICQGKDVGLYFDNNYYPAEQSTGRIVIPYGRQPWEGKALMLCDGFAQLTDFKREEETYTFIASVVVHNESLVLGMMAQILIKGTLLLNGREPADLRLLENTKVNLQAMNKVDQITVTKVIEQVDLRDDKDFIVEFQVPSGISTIKVNISSEVKVTFIFNLIQCITKDFQKQTFSVDKSFHVNNHSDDFEFCETFLRNVGGDYHLLVKNKNGEPIPDCLLNFKFQHKYYYTSREQTLKTDKEGIVTLGPLKNVAYVRKNESKHAQFEATPSQSRVIASRQKTWILPNRYQMGYPEGKTINLLEKETLKIPF